MKQLAIVFCGNDHGAARELAATIRNGEWNAVVASAYEFNRKEAGHRAYVMADVPAWHRDRIKAAFADTVISGQVATVACDIQLQPKRRRGRPPKVK